ncbi:hypothetical protein RRG08_053850 [Elysia crispata]|uniref:Uncharacterized protein n=1 Tax=Elysia crispata TaxID=231223 RepID=A0AAE1A815_9GAST|nr:hypothetical protein RRG08_053850 [Elysia crispata]
MQMRLGGHLASFPEGNGELEKWSGDGDWFGDESREVEQLIKPSFNATVSALFTYEKILDFHWLLGDLSSNSLHIYEVTFHLWNGRSRVNVLIM